MSAVPPANSARSTALDPQGLPARVAEALGAIAPDLESEAPLGIAVSGGGDSLALLHILAFLRPGHVHAVTVDHGLRAESGQEADHVAWVASELSVPHDILRWQGWSGHGNLQDAARNARLSLIADWARSKDISTVALGHTLDDQAETLVLRLARGSGVDGLSAISPSTHIAGIRWLRPMLDIRRAELRVYLGDLGVDWIDDPSNENEDFDRVKARVALEELARIGLSRTGLARTAAHQGRARAALEWMTEEALHDIAEPRVPGYVRLDAAGLSSLPEEIRLRVMSHCLGWIVRSVYPPRFSSLTAAMQAVCKGDDVRSLHGCLIHRKGPDIFIMREPARCAAAVRAGALWDGRWTSSAQDRDLWVSALGAKGLSQCPDWRDLGHPREALMATPAFWAEGQLVAAPFALPQKGCNVALTGGANGLFAVSGRR